MDHRILGLIIIIASGLILFSQESGSWIVSAVGLGLGTAIFLNLHKIKKDSKDE